MRRLGIAMLALVPSACVELGSLSGGRDTGVADGGADGRAADGASDGGLAPEAGGDTGTDGALDADASSTTCNGAIGCDRLVFLTSSRTQGSFGGVSGADQRCQSAADAIDALPVLHGRRFVAWLSDGATPVALRLVHGNGHYMRTDGAVIAQGWVDLTDGTIDAVVDLDEKGGIRQSDIWTDTSAVGGSSSTGDCNGWTSANAVVSGVAGDPSNLDGRWTNLRADGCDTQHGLLCIEY